MATMVGKEKDITKLLNDLIALDFDAIEAYEAAIARLDTAGDREQLARFMEDHRRHVRDLSELVRSFGEAPQEGADLKRILTKGKVVLAGLSGDEAVLWAMKSNEDDTNQAYERATASPGLPDRVLSVLRANLADERRHRSWIEQRLDAMKSAQAHP
jgi:uncharacterized protein (TIGR02284 family)